MRCVQHLTDAPLAVSACRESLILPFAACPQPKRPTSAYFYYAADARPEIKKTDPGLCGQPPCGAVSFSRGGCCTRLVA